MLSPCISNEYADLRIWSLNSIACNLNKSALIGIIMNDTDGENPPKSNESNNCWEPKPVPTNGSKYLTMAGGAVCNTLRISIHDVFDNGTHISANDADTA